jgi:hypothetical protein
MFNIHTGNMFFKGHHISFMQGVRPLFHKIPRMTKDLPILVVSHVVGN